MIIIKLIKSFIIQCVFSIIYTRSVGKSKIRLMQYQIILNNCISLLLLFNGRRSLLGILFLFTNNHFVVIIKKT